MIALDLPAQPLDQALNALAARTGLQVIFPTALAEGRRAPALRGNHPAPQALGLAAAGFRIWKPG
ncbi:STN domain-containing protein [Castellaniella defragrans]|uniref:STN domain-containing protein n=1 Tax=Castellaniella defragrans TaxID=75697 RepID=UPI002AFEBF2E|nr:STN domain-containing protein [Castellaniella defragrans]